MYLNALWSVVLLKNTKDQMKSCCRNKESYLMPVFKKLVAIMALLNVLFYCLSLFWGFSFKTLLGFLIGYIYVNLCYAYVAHTVEKSVNFDVKRAKRAMHVCFAVRYTGLFLLCFAAMQFKVFNVIGIIIPQFYPRIAFGIIQFIDRKSARKD